MGKTGVDAGARLDRLPIARFHRRLLAMIGAGMFLDGFELFLGAGVLGALAGSGWSTLAQNAQFVSATFAGMVIGAWGAGVVGDRLGRRFSYQINLLVFGLASLAGAAAPSMEWLIAARFFMGIGLGAEIVVGYVTLSEFVPPSRRGRWGAGLAVIANSALLASALLNYLIIPNFGWRWMFVIVGVAAMIVWFARKSMPESPRWLESKGRLGEAEAVLSGIEREVALEHELPEIPPHVAVQVAPQRSVWALFSGGILRRTLLGGLLLIVVNTVTYGFVAWIPTFMAKSGMSVVSTLGYSTLMSIGGPAGAAIGMLFSDRAGRKPVVVLASLAAAALGAVYPFVESPAMIALIGAGLVTAVYVLVAIGFALYVPELFPTDIRMRGTGFCNTLGRMMTIATPYVVVALFAEGGVVAVVVLMVGLLLLLALAIMVFGIETRGLSLEILAVQDGAGPSARSELRPKPNSA